MVVQVDPRPLAKLFNDFVGNNKVMFNFKLNGRSMDVQVLNDYTVTTTIPVESIDNDFSEVDISVWITKFIHVMAKDEMVQMTVNDAVLYIEQSEFDYTLLREYESRRELPVLGDIDLQQIFTGRMKYLAHVAVSCSAMAKELSISDPDPMFTGGRVYLNYNQAAFINSIEFPQVCVPISTFRDFVFRLGDKAQWVYLEDKDIIYYKSGQYEFWVPVTNYNINNNVIKTLDKKLASSTEITSVSFGKYREKLLIVAGAFPKQKMLMSFGDKSLAVMVNGNNSNVSAGDKLTDILASLAITTAQLTSIVKVFGDDEEVQVKKGVGCLCLVSGEKALMIAETVY